MDIKQLRYIVQIVDSGSVSRASETLRVAQPSLSLQLRSIEQELGVKLLIRHARGVSATEDGKVFVDHARKILLDMDRIHDVLRSNSSNPRGRVTVGLPTSACRGLSVPLIKAAAASYPGITVHIVEAMTGYLDEWIASGKLDVALLYDQKTFENVTSTELMVEELMVIVAPSAEIARVDRVSFASLSDLPLVLPGRTNSLRQVMDRIASRLDIDISATLDCDSLQAIIELVKAGYVSVLPSFAVDHAIKLGELCALPLVNPTPTWRVSLVQSKRSVDPRCNEAIMRVLAETIRFMVKAGTWRTKGM